MNAIRRLIKKYEDFLKFSLVGVANTLVDFTVYTVLYLLGVPYRIAQVFSYAAGTLNSYILNKKWTFARASGASAAKPAASSSMSSSVSSSMSSSVSPSVSPSVPFSVSSSGGTRKRTDWAQALKFLAVNLVSLGVSIVLLGFLKERLGLNALVAKVLVTAVTTLLNFVGSKLWVFRAEKPCVAEGSHFSGGPGNSPG